METKAITPKPPRRRSVRHQLSKPKAKRVLLFSVEDPKKPQTSNFYLLLQWQLLAEGRRRGFQISTAVAPSDNQHTLRHLNQLVAGGAIDGVIFPVLDGPTTDWLETAPIPAAASGPSHLRHSLLLNYTEMVIPALKCLAEQGCNTVGVMLPGITEPSSLTKIEEECDRLSLHWQRDWLIPGEAKNLILSGYDHFKALWSMGRRPDGLITFPDRISKGVVTAILERQIRVPSELKLVLHRNREGSFTPPFPCNWIEISVHRYAQLLFDALSEQWAPKGLQSYSIPFELIKTPSEDSL